jgi:anti-sigma-K factor RskA
MRVADRELVDRLAAEYALGTLRGGARRRFERWLVSPQVRSMVIDWEERLAGLEPPLEKVTPSTAVWRGIERRLELARVRRAPAMRWLAIAASVLLFGMLGVFALREIGIFTPPEIATQRATIAADPQTIYWRVELLGDNQELLVHVQSTHPLDADKAHELWILPAQGNPVSLGLLPASGVQRQTLTAAQRAALVGAKQLAVSVEPSGGSPTGLPTGPVIHVADLTAA